MTRGKARFWGADPCLEKEKKKFLGRSYILRGKRAPATHYADWRDHDELRGGESAGKGSFNLVEKGGRQGGERKALEGVLPPERGGGKRNKVFPEKNTNADFIYVTKGRGRNLLGGGGNGKTEKGKKPKGESVMGEGAGTSSGEENEQLRTRVPSG